MSTFNFYVFFLCIFFVVYILSVPQKDLALFSLYTPQRNPIDSLSSSFSPLLLPLTVVPVVRSIYSINLLDLQNKFVPVTVVKDKDKVLGLLKPDFLCNR